jgi:formate-nitrite transporter family protein
MATKQTDSGPEPEGHERAAAGADSPHLDAQERKQAATHSQIRALVIHEVLREEGEFELSRPAGALVWSGLAAGLSMGFSFLTLALFRANLPNERWAHVLAAFGYCVGFVITVLGKQQLFTETTLTAMLPVFFRPRWASAVVLLRMWAIVLVTNIAGTIAFAWLVSRQDLFAPEVRQALSATAAISISDSAVATVVKAMLAGWMIALMVWLLPSAGSAALFVIVLLTYVIALGQFSHIVAGSTEAAFAVFTGAGTVSDYVFRFFLPTITGNLFGGVALAALLNHAPVAHEIAAKVAESGDTPKTKPARPTRAAK